MKNVIKSPENMTTTNMRENSGIQFPRHSQLVDVEKQMGICDIAEFIIQAERSAPRSEQWVVIEDYFKLDTVLYP